MRELTGTLEEELWELNRNSWMRKFGFVEERFAEYVTRVEELELLGYDTTHHKKIIMAYRDAYKVFLQDQRAGVL